jgi:nucleotide-binding universal stress UspA family protein
MAGRIVVGVDGSEGSRVALRWAAEEARLHQADLDVVYSWHHPYETFVPMWGLPPWEELESQARETLEKLIADEGLSDTTPPTRAVLVQGPAAPVLLDAAKDADLLVVGARGHGAFTGMLLGSVSQHCVTHARCPVSVVPSGKP